MTIRVLAAFAFAFLLSLPQLTVAAESASKEGGADALATATPAQPARALAAARGADQGIKVHGDWIIEIKSPDGKVLQRHEFANAVSGGGPNALANLLARNLVVSLWRVAAYSTNANLCNNSTYSFCYIEEPASLASGGSVVKTLTVAVVNRALVLSGTFTATSDTPIYMVGTSFSYCPSSSPACSGPSVTAFTEKMLDSPISVLSGQLVAITVRISFS